MAFTLKVLPKFNPVTYSRIVSRQFSAISQKDIELTYLKNKDENGIAVIGLQRPAAKNAFRFCTNSRRNFSNEKNICKIELNYLTGDENGIAVLELYRPSAKNALSRPLIAQLTETTQKISNDPKIRAVIIRSLVPGIFCAGADLTERATLNPVETRKWSSDLRSVLLAIESLPIPVIAALDGGAYGGGLELALSCDFIVAAKDVRMGLVETSRGIMPGAGGTQRLSRRVGPSFAKELIFTSRILTGAEAKLLTICNHAVDQNDGKDGAYRKALEIAKEILPNGPIGVQLAKKAINKGMDVDLDTGLVIEDVCYAQTLFTKDRLEGLKAFAEKRKPKYIGE